MIRLVATFLLVTTLPLITQAQEARNWQEQCTSAARGAPLVCRATQTVVDAQSGAPIVRSTVVTSDELDLPGHALLSVELPVGVHIPSGVTLGNITLALETCDTSACYAQTPFSGEISDMFLAGGSQPLIFRMAPDQDVSFTLQLDGFAQSFNAIKIAK
ncbi:invasion associated locus B family protein [Aliiroseovarius sp. F20344]|uniref:invasion associated locus B family protein n=1 Tax=Aliiroseovarius sp. F20344 TaxID=2926414 RepID=UPI001FF66C21|nr:invasion associated locus B family protein [Aliiroseovarius sp. F20344]MCK0142931.1 invasion associated locus B family protein [Aliiroseovarius sp. F20344]